MVTFLVAALLAPSADPTPLSDQAPNTWVKRSPLPGGPPLPGLGYEGALAWDSKNKRVIRFAGHNQGGGGEQNAETWSYDPLKSEWELKEPNTSPPGACCNQQNLFDTDQGRFLRFPAFSGSHGWHWFRENYLSNSTIWNYDLATNTWRDRRPAPTPRVAPLRCASWDSDHQVAVIFGGEGSREGTVVYDPYTNTWHRMKSKVEPDPRSGGNMAYDAASGLHVMLGSQFDNDLATWTYDLRKNEWQRHKPAISPPTDRNDPVLAYDANVGQVIALVRAVDKSEGKEVVAGHLETWSFHVGTKTWAKLSPAGVPDSWSSRARVMVEIPELNVLLLESVISPARIPGANREQQIWTYRTAATRKPTLLPPTNVRTVSLMRGVQLQWDAPPGAVKCSVLAGTGDTPWTAKFEPIGETQAPQNNIIDQSAGRDRVMYYRIKAIAADGTESLSPIVRSQPRVPDDVVVSFIDAKRVRVSWKPVKDAAGYHVERAPVEVFTEDQLHRLKKDTDPLAEPSVGGIRAIGSFVRITKEPVPVALGFQVDADQFLDTGIDLTNPTIVVGEPTFMHRFAAEQIDAKGKPYRFGVYAYRVRAVNALGVESGPSAWVPTIPSSVKKVFAKEAGAACHLKWTSNPEEGIKGYRVYRMDGPKINGAGQKVLRRTPDPLSITTWTDSTAGTDTKRFWIVALDALGQEGIPSAPVWSNRQFRKEYGPFTGEWHQ